MRPAGCLRTPLSCVCAAMALAIVSASTAQAATKTWSASPASGNWSNGANWVGGLAPVAGDGLVFPASSSIMSTTNDLANGISIASLTFDGNGYALSGNAITLAASGIACTTGASPQTNHVGLPIVLGATVTVNLTAGCELWLDGVVSGAFGIAKSGGSGNLRFNAANSFTGTVVVNAGIVLVDNSQGLGAADGTAGTGTTVAAGNSLIVSTPSVGNEYLSLSGIGFGGLAGALYNEVSAAWSGPVVLAADTTIFVATGTLTLSGPVTGPGGLTVTGNFPLVLTGSDSYLGATVDKGRLLVNGTLTGSTSVTVNGASQLGGTGTIASSVATLSASALTPGTSPGILTVGNTTLGSNTNFQIEIAGPVVGSQYDQLDVAGTIDVSGANLNLFPSFIPAPGTQFVVVENDGGDPIVGTFAGVPEGGTITQNGATFSVSYVGGTGNDVVLTATTASVPTANASLLVILTGLLAAVSVRRLRLGEV